MSISVPLNLSPLVLSSARLIASAASCAPATPFRLQKSTRNHRLFGATKMLESKPANQTWRQIGSLIMWVK